ncbi:MAG: tRNA pseudouridine(38-40) synthase TruA [Dehalococcoidales bacterium]|nr:tRNA pseudouridine(38-40) synthase TruA [Dehalococcoidales bacterium]
MVLIVEYDGTNYHGSQYQANARTIQGEVEKALKMLTGERTRVKLAGRTDAGVHACGQVIGFDAMKGLPLRAFVDGLNHYLPDDIAVKKACYAPANFDVRRAALSREYRYRILTSPTRSPLRQRYAHRVEGRLDTGAMKEACRLLIGRHDFASFTTVPLRRTVRDVFRAEIDDDDDTVTFTMVANSFLPHQVRNTAGALIRVGQGKMTVEEFRKLIEAKTPGLAGPTAPASGLCLVKVNYAVEFQGDPS